MRRGRSKARDGGRAETPALAYDAFISYSHAWDRDIAKAFQSALQGFDRPWYRPRSLRLFRDETNLAASPHLWREIEWGLSRSRWLVVMASPSAATSPWVRREIRWWLDHRSADTLLIGWTDGTLCWDPEQASFDWSRTDALPREEMERVHEQEPRWVDLRWLRTLEQTGSDPRLIECVAEFVAPLTGKSKDELIGDHVRQRRRTRRWVQGTVAVLVTLLLLAVAGGITAYNQRNNARAQTLVAQSRQLVAEATSIRDSQPDLARQLMVQAYRLAPTAEAVGALVDSYAMPRVVRGRGPVRAAAYSSRGLLAVADDGGRLLDPARGTRPTAVDLVESPVTAVAFSPDGRLLALGGADGRVWLLDVTDGSRPRTLAVSSATDGHAGIVALVLTSGGRLIAMTERGGAVLDVRDPKRPRTLTSLPDHVIAASPKGDLVATDVGGGRLRLWTLSGNARLRLVATLTAPPAGTFDYSHRAAFSLNGQMLAVGGDGSRVTWWDVTDPAHPVARPELYAQSRLGIQAVAFSADATTLATGDSEGTVALWDVSDPLRPRAGARLSGHTTRVSMLSFSPDGHTVASVGGDSSDTGAVRLWAVSGSERTSAFTTLPTAGIFPPAFSADSRLLAAGGEPTTVWQVGDTRAPRLMATLESYNAGGQASVFDTEGRTLFSGLPVRAWNLTDPANPRNLTPRTPRTGHAQSLSVNPALPLLVAVAGPGEAVQLWDISRRTNPSLLATLGTLGDAARARQVVAFSPDGELLAAPTRGGGVRLWRVARQARPRSVGDLPAARGKTTAMAFSPHRRILFVGTETGEIISWDVSRPGRPVRKGTSARHTAAIDGFAFHPGGDLAATAGQDSRIRLWDVSAPERPVEVASLSGGLYLPATVDFSPDGRLLAVGGHRGLRLWSVDRAGILQRLCAESPRITPDQWTQYLPDQPYDPPCA
ncbi:TIR domain-containing protein [Streptomyces pharetrae]|uniref:TIR domain-containing protein n=1 Tax=Streptomyces pharetrae TaxID=291370 RepID=UPI00346141E5